MTEQTQSSERSFFETLAILWTIRIKQFLSSFRQDNHEDRLRNVLLITIFFAFIISLVYLFNQLFLEFLQVPVLGIYVMLQTLSLIFLSFFLLLLFSSMVTSLSTQFMSSDLDFLFSTDIHGSTLYWAKFGEALFHAAWMVVVFAYPILVSYGYAIGAPWFFYPVALIILIPFVLVPFSLGSFIVNAVLYFIPVRRVRSVLVAVGVVFGISIIYILRLLSPRLLFEPNIARDRFVEFLSTLRVGKLTGLPSYHAAYSLHRITADAYWKAAYHGIVLLFMAVLATLLLGYLSQYWYRESWLRTREGRPNQQRLVTVDDWAIWSIVPGRFAGLFKKEILQFIRQATQWSQLLVLGGIMFVHVSNLLEIPAESQFLNYVLFFINLALIGFVMTAVCVRFVFPSISFEGEYFWIVRSSPISMYEFFLQKTLFYVIPISLLGLLLAVITNSVLAISWTLWGWSILFLTGLSLVLTSGALTAGTYFPKFHFDHFGEVVTSAGSVIYMVFGMFYVAGLVGVSVLPVYYIFTGSKVAGGPELLRSLFPGTVVVLTILNILITIFLLGMGSRKIQDYASGRL